MKRLMVLMVMLFCMCGNAWGLSTERSGLIYYPTDGASAIAINSAIESRGYPATIKFTFGGSGVSKAYILSSDVTFSELATLEHEHGAMLSWSSGVTITLDPTKIDALPSQQIWDRDGGLIFSEPGTIPIAWNGVIKNIETEAQATKNLDNINSLIYTVSSVTGCLMTLEAGDYWFEASERRYFYIRDNVHFKGQGKDEVSNFKWIDFDPTPVTGDVFFGLMTDRKNRTADRTNVTNLSFEDMCIDNSGVSPNNPDGSGGMGSRGISLVLGDGIKSDPTLNVFRMKNISIDNTKWICWALPESIRQALNVKITNSDFVNPPGVNGTPSIDVLNGSRNVIITGNYVEDILWEAATQSSINCQASDLLISNNTVGSSFYGGGILEESGERVIISNNIVDLTRSQWDSNDGIIIAGETGTTDVLVTGNLLIMNPDISLDLTCRGIQISRNTHNVEISNNIVKNFYTGIENDTSDGFYVSGWHLIENNTIVDSLTRPYFFNGDNGTFTDVELSFIGNTIISGSTSVDNRCVIRMTSDSGPTVIKYNEGAEIYLDSLSEDHHTYIGNNFTPGMATYNNTAINALSDAEWNMIEWDGVTYITSPEMDLTGSDTTYYLDGYDYNKRYLVVGIDMFYSETASLSGAVTIYPRLYDIDGLVTTLPIYTSGTTDPIRTIDNHRIDSNLSYYDVPAIFATRNVGGGTGTGSITATWGLIEQ